MSEIPVVIVQVPRELGAVELAVHHRDWGVEVDVRPAGTRMSWRPIDMYGGTFTVREA